MDNRKFQSAASVNPPAAEASPSIGYPTDGNPATATPATVPGAAWFHQLGEELRSLQLAAGLTPSNSDLTQLLQALRSSGVFQTQSVGDQTTKAATTAFVNPGHLLSSIGYLKLPCGLIMQWGMVTTDGGGAGYVSFPISFPSAIYSLVVAGMNTGASTHIINDSPTVSNFVVKSYASSGILQPYLSTYWIALGK